LPRLEFTTAQEALILFLDFLPNLSYAELLLGVFATHGTFSSSAMSRSEGWDLTYFENIIHEILTSMQDILP